MKNHILDFCSQLSKNQLLDQDLIQLKLLLKFVVGLKTHLIAHPFMETKGTRMVTGNG